MSFLEKKLKARRLFLRGAGVEWIARTVGVSVTQVLRWTRDLDAGVEQGAQDGVPEAAAQLAGTYFETDPEHLYRERAMHHDVPSVPEHGARASVRSETVLWMFAYWRRMRPS